jgi:hypothetical protein
VSQRLLLYLFSVLLLAPAHAQQTSVFATGLQLPYKLAVTPAGTLLVSEAGGPPNAGRISLISRAGARQSLLEGLPSGLSNSPDLTPIGPTGLAYRNRVLYISVGEGDSVRNGTTPGSLILNPAGVSSPLFHSVLRVRFDADLEGLQSPFVLKKEQHGTLADGYEVTLTNTDGRKATMDVLADFPPVTSDPNTIYRHEDPFGLSLDQSGQFLYLAEAGQNALFRINAETGRTQVVTRFAPLPNPTKVGPPVIDSVPTATLVLGDQVLVTQLSGFPFLPGFGSVRAVDLTTKATGPWITGLNSAIDIALRITSGGDYQFFVLGFSSNMTATPPGPGQLLLYDSPVGRVIADQLVSPTGMVVDPLTGDIFVAELGPGRITRVQVP